MKNSDWNQITLYLENKNLKELFFLTLLKKFFKIFIRKWQKKQTFLKPKSIV